MLPEIVDTVSDKITVLFDSGIRTGADIVKALCISAKGVLVGRPAVYGLAIAGKVWYFLPSQILSRFTSLVLMNCRKEQNRSCMEF